MKMNDRKGPLTTDWRFSWHRGKQRHRAFILLALATLTFCLISTPFVTRLSPVAAATKAVNAPSALPCDGAPAPLSPPAVLFAQGRQCYDAGAFARAETIWATAATAYAQTGDRSGEISSRINQAQALKALGNYSLALKLLENLAQTVPSEPPFLELKAKMLRSLGDVQQLVGDSGTARTTLQQSFQIAQSLQSAEAMSAACFSIGLVDRAEINRIQLQGNEPDPALQQQVILALQHFQMAAQKAPTPINKVQAALNQLSLMVNVLPQFNAFLATLPTLKDSELRLLLPPSPASAQNVLASPPQSNALPPCTTIATQSNTSVSEQPASQLRLSIRNQTVQLTDALLNELSQVQAQLLSLPPSRATVDARINFAQSLMRLRTVANSAVKVDRRLNALLKAAQLKQPPSLKQPLKPSQKTPVQPIFLSVQVQSRLQSIAASSFQDAAKVLGQAIDEAHALPNPRSEALARVTLAELYATWETASHQTTEPQTKLNPPNRPTLWADVEALSQEALTLATESEATAVIYQAQRQLAQAYQKQKKIPETRASCKVAAATLQSLRGDLVAIDQDVQFNFRDKVEPFYRECAAAFLPSGKETPEAKDVQRNLEEARTLIESLQLAEIDDFLREACIQGQKVQIDKLVEQNPTTAFIYAIVLSDRKLGVIAKIPDAKEIGKKKAVANLKESEQTKLLYQTVEPSGQETIPMLLTTLREQLTSLSADRQQLENTSNKVYQLLITPFKEQLERTKTKKGKIDTLVFVLDEALRNIPMAALYDKDSQRYLIQDYAIAISPGLQLLDSKPITQEKLNVFAAGLSEKEKFPPGFPELDSLPGVKVELKFMEEAKVVTHPLLDEGFKKAAFVTALNNTPYNIVHLATHGKFSSIKKDNYILASDIALDVTQLSEILRSRSQSRKEPIELLVLSACETAKGDKRATLGLAGFALKSGVRSTLASLWSVNDGSTAALMKKFYEVLRDSSLAKGDAKLTKARALQLAQQELLNTESNSSPSQWAPYVLIGNWL